MMGEARIGAAPVSVASVTHCHIFRVPRLSLFMMSYIEFDYSNAMEVGWPPRHAAHSIYVIAQAMKSTNVQRRDIPGMIS